MFGAIAISDFAFIRRIGRALKKILKEIHGVVKKIGIGCSDIDVELAAKLRPKG